MTLTPRKNIFLHPGELYFGSGEVRVATLLGSCVSITLWHPIRRHGGICHFMLDSRSGDSNPLDGRYADEAMELFMAELKKQGTHQSEYEAKIFGGGNMLPIAPKAKGVCADPACRNVAASRRLLDRYGFSLRAEHVGGAGHRKVLFDLWSGDVWMKFHDISQTPRAYQ